MATITEGQIDPGTGQPIRYHPQSGRRLNPGETVDPNSPDTYNPAWGGSIPFTSADKYNPNTGQLNPNYVPPSDGGGGGVPAPAPTSTGGGTIPFTSADAFNPNTGQPNPNYIPPTTDITAPVTGQAFQDSDAYKSLTGEEKEIVDLLFGTIQLGGQQESEIFANAIQQALAIADPWVKAKAAMALAEFALGVDETVFGFDAKMEAVQRARDILLEDVGLAKEFLTLEQQAEVAQQTRKYDEDLLDIADWAAEKGITFATGRRSRVEAEARREEQFEDVIQSKTREYNFRIKELELRAQRGDVEAQKELERLTGEKGFKLKDIGLEAEKILGTGGIGGLNLPGGYTPVGGQTGAIEEEKERRIISDVGGIISLQQALTE